MAMGVRLVDESENAGLVSGGGMMKKGEASGVLVLRSVSWRSQSGELRDCP
jgi:hypothetical protein